MQATYEFVAGEVCNTLRLQPPGTAEVEELLALSAQRPAAPRAAIDRHLGSLNSSAAALGQVVREARAARVGAEDASEVRTESVKECACFA
jgi:hypothetical protein